MKEIDAAYIAGLFDGEGCISGHIPKGQPPTVKISIAQKRTEILYWIKKLLGMGEVYTYRTSQWRITNKRDIRRFIDLILPYSKVKKDELMIGRKLNILKGEAGHECNPENYRERMILYNQLKLLKRGR